MKRLALLSLVALGACAPTVPDPVPSPGTTINISGNTGTINIGNGNGGGASPAPNNPADVFVESVKITEIAPGDRCPAGTLSSEPVPRTLRVGCSTTLTCTPFDKNGNELPHEHPPTLESFGVVDGAQFVTDSEAQDDSKGYNRVVFGKAAGKANFGCRVAGKSAPIWTLDVVP